jgi:RNA polymerase sigma-70 factor (ECF subfamily)
LERAIDALPEAHRITVVMHDIEGYTHAEIAAALGVAEGTSKSRLFDARARLRAALADFARE